ncbi:MAG: hypothetical protein WA160_10840 [Pseudobdellovibrio sp.]
MNFILGAILTLNACVKKNAALVTTTEPGNLVATPQSTDVKALVSVGAGINFNGSTGSWSEMAMNPVTSNPEIIYYDRTALVSPITGALKYAAMTENGTWKIEVIDANSPVTAVTNTCGGGLTTASCIGAPNVAIPTASQSQIYDIKHLLNSGVTTPVVAYAYGTGGASSSTSGKYIRFAARSTSGSWIIETAVTGAQILAATVGAVGPKLTTLEYPIKGVRLLVDDNNRVHLVFAVYAATANNSVYLYTMRTAAGTWLTPTVISTASPSLLNFVSGAPAYAAGTGLLQTGAAWCKYNSGGTSADATGILISTATTDNTPAASTQGFILKCATANSDGSCATWQGLDFTAGCSGACVTTTPASISTTASQANRSDIAIDPISGSIFLSYFSSLPSLTAPATIATGILSTKSPLACSSGLSSTAWSAVRAYPTAAQGTMGLRVAADGTNYYLASLAAATGTSITLNKQTSALSANWNTSPDQVTIEATTNTVAGGFSYNSLTGVLWGSYGAFTAAASGTVGQDIKVFGAYPTDITSTGFVNTNYVDQTNFVAQSAPIPMLDAAIAPNGTIGYAYFYQEPGTAGPNSHLYYGTRGGTALSPTFGEKIVSNSISGATTFLNGLHPSLAFDKNNNPAISFLDQGTAASTGYLMVARSNNGGVSFELDRVDGSIVATKNVGQFSSIDISAANTIGVAYYDYSTGATGQRLAFAKREKNGNWRRFIVDGPSSSGIGCDTTTTASIGLYAQFKWTSSGRPVITYQGSVSGIKSLRLAYGTENESTSTYTWKCLTLDTNSQGSNSRAEGIDFVLDANDNPYIAHYDYTGGALRVVTCPAGSGVLTCGAVGSSAFIGERLNYIIGSITPAASRPGIRVDKLGKIWVSYHSPSDQGLFIASKSSGSNGVWDATSQVIESTPTGVGSVNTGLHSVLLLNSNDLPMMLYRSFENWIKYFSREPN